MREKRIWLVWRGKAQKQPKTPKVTPGGVPGKSLTRRGFEGNQPRSVATYDTQAAPTGASMTPEGELPQPLETTRIAGRCDRREGAKRPPPLSSTFFDLVGTSSILLASTRRRESSLIPLCLLSKPQPLRWVAVWFLARIGHRHRTIYFAFGEGWNIPLCPHTGHTVR